MDNVRSGGATLRSVAGGRAPVAPGPALPLHWVARRGLHAELTAATHGRVTAVTGPPGSGKSVLLAGWSRASLRPGETAWVSLQPADNDPESFWRHLRDALGLVHASLRGPGVEALARRVARLAPTVLVLDNFDLIASADVAHGLEQFLGQLPAHVRVVLSGRHHLALPAHRLRLSGELTEIACSSFSVDETADLFAASRLSTVPREYVRALTERTEGWAAGLRLAALTLAGGDAAGVVAGFDGDFHLVAEYFGREVLDAQAPDVNSFLLRTSVLDEMTGELCESVSGRSDAGEILESLADHNLFVTRLDPADRRYRYHRLFRSFLRHRLDLEGSSAVRQAHLRAGAWFEHSGTERVAMHHLVRAGQYDRAFDLGVTTVIRQLGTWLLRRDEILLPGEIPEEYFEGEPSRMYALGAALLCAFRTADAASWLRRLERTTGEDDSDPWRARAERLWTLHDSMLSDLPGILRHAERAADLAAGWSHLVRSPGRSWLAAMDASLDARLPLVAARAHLLMGQPAAARAILDRVSATDYPTDSPTFLGALANVALGEGRLREAAQLASAALEEAGRHPHASVVPTLESRLVLAGVLYERDELEAAVEQLELAEEACGEADRTPWGAAVECARARVRIAEGRSGEAVEGLLRLRRTDAALPAVVVHQIDGLEIRARLALGDLEGAGAVLASMAVDDQPLELLARVDLSAGRPDRAASRLAAAVPAGARRVEIERLLLHARAHAQLGSHRLSGQAVGRAVELGRAEEYRRVFLDDPEVLQLLRLVASRAPDPYVAGLVAGADRRGSGGPAGICLPLALEPLTERERELLNYLPSHLSQPEIAALMYISLNTVKTHMKGLYRKLGAASRSQAVDLARGHGLLEGDAFTLRR